MGQHPAILDERLGLPSASSFDQIEACPGSFLAQRGMPEVQRASNKFGNIIHEALEGRRKPESLNKSQLVTYSRIANEEARLFDQFEMHGAYQIREERFFYNHSRKMDCFERLWSAKPDVIHHTQEGKCLGINYKSGFSNVKPIRESLQVLAEAVAAWKDKLFKKVVWALIHPNAKNQDQVGFSQAKEFSDLELSDGEEKLKGLAILAMSEDAPRMAGEQCFFCKAQGNCPEYLEYENEKNNFS